MVETTEQVPQGTLNSTETTAPKQKKQRQRNRPKNKRNRVEDNGHSIIKVEATVQTEIETMPKVSSSAPAQEAAADKTREQIMAEREAKKQAKLAKKQKSSTPATTIITEVEQTTITTKLTTTTTTTNDQLATTTTTAATTTAGVATVQTEIENMPKVSNAAAAQEATADKTRDQIKAEREAKKAVKQATKGGKANHIEESAQQLDKLQLAEEPEKKKPALSKADRRALQEAQRAAKAQGQTNKSQPAAALAKKAAPAKPAAAKPATATPISQAQSLLVKRESASPIKCVKLERECKVKLFNHLACAEKGASLFINDPLVHPSMARLGEQYARRTVVGSNARCIAFLNALRQVVQDFETPAKKEFGRSLDAAVKHHVDHLHKCRPLAVSVCNAYKQFKNQLTQLPADKPEIELKEMLCHFIDTYIENQIGKAAQAISSSLQEKITDGDVLLTFACSSLIHYICEEAKRRKVHFRVIVVDARPFCEGQEMLRRLHAHGIPCTYVLINAISYVMPEATKVLLGAHALLSNGYVMARTGTAQVALVAHAHNVPVLVCCETHKFSERFQTDAIVYNEMGDPNELIVNAKCCLNNWQAKSKLSPLNLNYDITPPELVSAVVTEVAILPCTSVPVILRIKPDIGY